MKKESYFSWIGLAIVIIPTIILFSAALNNYFGVGPFSAISSAISGLPFFTRIIFSNILFFLFPLISIILGILGFRMNKLLGLTLISLGILVIGWFGVHLWFD